MPAVVRLYEGRLQAIPPVKVLFKPSPRLVSIALLYYVLSNFRYNSTVTRLLTVKPPI